MTEAYLVVYDNATERYLFDVSEKKKALRLKQELLENGWVDVQLVALSPSTDTTE